MGGWTAPPLVGDSALMTVVTMAGRMAPMRVDPLDVRSVVQLADPMVDMKATSLGTAWADETADWSDATGNTKGRRLGCVVGCDDGLRVG